MNGSALSGEFAGRMLLIAALLSGCALMSPLVHAGRLVLDEHGSYWIAGSEHPGRLVDRSIKHAAIPPLSSWVQRCFLTVAGKSEFSFRASSAVAYLLAIVFTFLLGREFLGPLGAGAAAMIVAWHPSVLDEVRIARCYGLLLMLSALSLWITVRWRKQPRTRYWIIAWPLANAAMVWTHYVSVPLIPLELLLLLGLLPMKGHRATPDWSHLAVAVLFLALLLMGLFPAVLRLWNLRVVLNYNREGLPLSKIIGPIWWLGLPAGWAAGLLIAIFRKEWRTSLKLPENFWTLAVWGLLPLASVALFSQGNLTTLSNPRYSIPYAVPAACFLAACLASHKSVPVVLVGLITALGTGWFAHDLAPWEMRRLGDRSAIAWYEMAQTIEQDGQPGEPIFVLCGLVESSLVPVPDFREDPLFMDYVSCRLGGFYLNEEHPRYGLPLIWPNDNELDTFYINLLEQSCSSSTGGFWVAVATDTDLNRMSLAHFQTLLKSHGFVETMSHPWDSAMLIQYRCPTGETTSP